MTDDAAMRLLVLLRHAKAESSSPDGDLGRDLTDKGRAAARDVGRWLVDQGVRPDVVVVSPSTRTVATWEGLKQGGVRAREVWSDAAIYDADPEDILESVRAVPDEARTVVVIGHAPGVPAVAGDLPDHRAAGGAGPSDGWPPAAVAVVGHHGPWAAFPEDRSAVVAFRRPE